MRYVILGLVFCAAFALKMLGWRFVRQIDQKRRAQLTARRKVGLFSSRR